MHSLTSFTGRKKKYIIRFTFMLYMLTNWFNIFSQNNFYREEIQNLTNDSLRMEYLEKIFKDDQDIRHYWGESSIKDTSYMARKRVLSEVRAVDSINLIKVTLYLDEHGYPEKSIMGGRIAMMVPWLIIHHATLNDVRIQYYPTLLKAYEEGNLKKQSFRMYLCRALNVNENKTYDDFSRFKVEKLVKKMNRVHDRYNRRK